MSKLEELIQKHGTRQEFARAIRQAVRQGMISLDEANAAIEKYKQETNAARRDS